eukprot:s395_g42.t1
MIGVYFSLIWSPLRLNDFQRCLGWRLLLEAPFLLPQVQLQCSTELLSLLRPPVPPVPPVIFETGLPSASTASTSSGNPGRVEAAHSQTASLAIAATAVAALTAGGRKALGNVKPTRVNLTAFENELGVQAPVGFWDPVGFTSDGDVATFKRRRSVELKHGRISMMATMGFLIAVHERYITPEITGKLPGFLSPSAGLKFADIPNGLAAISKVPVAGWAQIAAYFGFVEFSGGFDGS